MIAVYVLSFEKNSGGSGCFRAKTGAFRPVLGIPLLTLANEKDIEGSKPPQALAYIDVS
jgi:hypothetical protein